MHCDRLSGRLCVEGAGVSGSAGERVRRARRRMGWTQRELAVYWERSVSYVQKIEQGVLTLDDVSAARRLAGLTGV
jgi:ribosome-binding protein aMBF1 (putative translation factor)